MLDLILATPGRYHETDLHEFVRGRKTTEYVSTT